MLIILCRDGKNFLNRCTKPDKREFLKISQAVGIGFVVMGAIGYVVKLIRMLPLTTPALRAVLSIGLANTH